jgi:hypothetical protein
MALRSASIVLLLGTALFGITGCAAAPLNKPMEGGPANTGAGTVTAAREYLRGRWSLESFDLYLPGKPPATLKGSGTITYDEFGNLRMDIRADRDASDLLSAAGVELGKDGVISSDGRTAVDMQNRTLTYFIEGQPVGTGPFALNRPRYWQVQGNVLTLTTKGDGGQPLSISRWKKSS